MNYYDYCKVLRKAKVLNLQKDYLVSSEDFDKLRKFIESRLKSFERKSKSSLMKKHKKNTADKKKKGITKTTNLPGVYGKIQKTERIDKYI